MYTITKEYYFLDQGYFKTFIHLHCFTGDAELVKEWMNSFSHVYYYFTGALSVEHASGLPWCHIPTSLNHPLELPSPPLTFPHLAVFSLAFILVCCLPHLLTGKTPDTSISNLCLVVSRLHHNIHSSHNKMKWTSFKYFNLVEKPRPCNGDLETQQIRNLCTQNSSSYFILQPQQYWNAIRLKKIHLIRKAQIDWIKTGLVRWRGITLLHVFRLKNKWSNLC